LSCFLILSPVLVSDLTFFSCISSFFLVPVLICLFLIFFPPLSLFSVSSQFFSVFFSSFSHYLLILLSFSHSLSLIFLFFSVSLIVQFCVLVFCFPVYLFLSFSSIISPLDQSIIHFAIIFRSVYHCLTHFYLSFFSLVFTFKSHCFIYVL
jgi:hypothetical protein